MRLQQRSPARFIRVLRPPTRTPLVYSPCLEISQSQHQHVDRHIPLLRRQLRSSSTFISRTSITATEPGTSTHTTPSTKLFDALQALGKTSAKNYVNQSLLNLTLRGFESDVVRVRLTVLSLDDYRASVDLLFSLTFGDQSPWSDWEKAREHLVSSQHQHILVNYGQTFDSGMSLGTLPYISIPSPFLKSRRIEILLSLLSPQREIGGDVESLIDKVLNQSLEIPISGSGRMSHITYPVHCAIVFGHGMQGSLRLGRLIAAQDELPPSKVINFVLDTPIVSESKTSELDFLTLIDLSQQNTVQNLDGNTVSGPVSEQQITGWLLNITKPAGEPPSHPNKNLIGLILDEASKSIDHVALKSEIEHRKANMNDTQRELERSLTIWAQRAHKELQEHMQIAFASRRWGRLAWWKLFWRVDDVAATATELVQQNLLANAEKEAIYLAGQIDSADGNDDRSESFMQQPLGRPDVEGDGQTLLTQHAIEDESVRGEDLLTESFPSAVRYPWPSHITIAQEKLVSLKIPPLQKSAQGLVIQTLSISSVSALLSMLVFFASGSNSMYEAGALTAFGTAYALRRLQIRWSKTQQLWQNAVVEDGRVALRDTEGLFKEKIKTRRLAQGEVLDIQDVKDAQQAIEEARTELLKLSSEKAPA